MLNRREIPFVRLLLPFMAGIAAALAWDQPVYWLPAVLLLLFLVVVWVSLRSITFRWRWLYGVLVSVFLGLLGYQLAVQNNELRRPDHFQKYLLRENLLLVQVAAPPKDGKRLRVKASVSGIKGRESDWQSCGGNLLLYLEPNALQSRLRYGDQLLIRGKAIPIPPSKNPEAFDFRTYQHFQNTHYQLFVRGDQWKMVRQGQGSVLLATAFRIRDHFLQTLQKYLPTDEELGVAAAMILGNRDVLTREVRHAYASTGATHVLAVSGLHVGFIYLGLAFLWGLLPFYGRRQRLLRTLIILLGVWAFAFITGASSSVLRAATMFSFIILGKAFDRNANIYNTLAISAFLLLCIDPYLLADIGFQLSYLAVIGIVSFQGWIYRLWIIDNPVGDKIWKLVTVSLAAQLTTFPISLFYFHQFPLYFWLSGLVVVPAAMIILSLGVVLFFLESVFPVIAFLAGTVLYWIVWLMNALIYFIQQLPAALLEGLWIGREGMLMLYILLGVLTWVFWKGKRFRVLASLFALSIILGTMVWQAYSRAGQRQIVLYHVSRSTLVDVVDGRSLISIQSPDLTSEQIDFAAQNYRWKLGIKDQESIDLQAKNQSSQTWWYHEGHLQFYDTRLALVDSLPVFETPETPEVKPKLDYLVLRNNPKIEIRDLEQFYDYTSLVADASNAPWTVAAWKRECEKLGIDFRDLAETGALIIEIK